METHAFYGQQEGERVLYELVIHPLVLWLRLVVVVVVSIALGGLFWMIGGVAPVGGDVVRLVGVVTALAVLGLGWWAAQVAAVKTRGYLTDRRIVRIAAVTPWAVASRSITWDEVVKVKTKSTNLFWQFLNIGSVIIHARSTVAPLIDTVDAQVVTNDDIQMDGIEYYKDLGNYIDKILYLYRREPEKLVDMRGFVPKPMGKRY